MMTADYGPIAWRSSLFFLSFVAPMALLRSLERISAKGAVALVFDGFLRPFQPSEFLNARLVVVAAWMMAALA